jgi:hypothetical protein
VFIAPKGLGWLSVVGSSNSYKPITNTARVRTQLCELQKGCTRLAAASDKVYQLLAQGRWFSPGTLASSTTKTGRHDIAEILLKVLPNTFKLFGFPIFWFWVYLKVIPEILSVLEGYSRNASYTLSLISTLLLYFRFCDSV